MKLELDISKINVILKSLWDQPYSIVYELIGDITQQAQAQMKAEQENSDDKD